MNRLAAAEARQEFATLINRVAFGHERIVLHRHGKDLVALITMKDLAFLEELEDRLDLLEAQEIVAEAEMRNEKPVPWNKVKKNWKD